MKLYEFVVRSYVKKTLERIYPYTSPCLDTFACNLVCCK